MKMANTVYILIGGFIITYQIDFFYIFFLTSLEQFLFLVHDFLSFKFQFSQSHIWLLTVEVGLSTLLSYMLHEWMVCFSAVQNFPKYLKGCELWILVIFPKLNCVLKICYWNLDCCMTSLPVALNSRIFFWGWSNIQIKSSMYFPVLLHFGRFTPCIFFMVILIITLYKCLYVCHILFCAWFLMFYAAHLSPNGYLTYKCSFVAVPRFISSFSLKF